MGIRGRRAIWLGGVLVVLVVGVVGLWLLLPLVRAFFFPATSFSEASRVVLIEPGSDAGAVGEVFEREGIVADGEGVSEYLLRTGGVGGLYGGRYRIGRGWTVRAMALAVAGGSQEPVMLVVPSTRTYEEWSGRVARQLWLDSSDLVEALVSPAVAAELGVGVAEVACVLIPNSYEVYWDVSVAGLLKRLLLEADRFWRGEREAKLSRLGLSRCEVYTLASIIQEEVMRDEELPVVAGVYMNRLRRGMQLGACPTAKYAAGDLGIRRVLHWHTQIESPYNTYLHAGLPPGPIRITTIRAIDAVLDYEEHEYLYFCARDDFSGYHYFSRSGAEHQRYARRYQRALDRRGY